MRKAFILGIAFIMSAVLLAGCKDSENISDSKNTSEGETIQENIDTNDDSIQIGDDASNETEETKETKETEETNLNA